MHKAIAALMLVGSLVPVGIAVALLLGIGLERQVAPVTATLVAGMLILLPIGGLATLLGNRPLSAAVAAWLWPILVLLGSPIYFPGERSGALGTGLGFLGSAGGLDSARTAANMGEAIGALLGEELGAARTPPPLAPALTAPELPPSRATDDTLALPFEGAGRSLHFDVTFEAKNTVEVPMLFDTGATYTTLNAATLRALGASPDANAPEITLHTANGDRQARIVLIDRVWLGNYSVEGVTIAVCEECGGQDAVGLLGLNVSGQFTTTVDPARHELLLNPRTDEANRQLDVGQWVDISATATAWTDGRLNVVVEAASRAPRRIAEIRVGIHCGGQDFESLVRDIPARGKGSVEVALPRGTQCSEYRVSLDRAIW